MNERIFRLSVIGMLAGLASWAPGARAHEGHSMSQEKGTQSIDLYPEGGSLHVLTVEYGASGRPRILYSVSRDGGATFSKAVRVDAGLPEIAYANRGNDIPLAVDGRRIVAFWPTQGSGYMGSGPIVVSRSEDGGASWGKGRTPADDGTRTGHRFLATTADGAGALDVVWLDNRTKKQALYFARSMDGGKSWSKNATIDPETCDCCWNRIAAAVDGRLYVLYRGVKPRDMALAVSQDHGTSWTTRKGIGGFRWDINICPHAGGGLAISRMGDKNRVHVLVYNGKDGSDGLYYLSSADDGRTWSAARRLADGRARHGDIAASPDGKRLVAAWDSDGIYYSRSVDGGGTWSRPEKLSRTGVRATHPRTAAFASGFRVFWTEHEDNAAARLVSAAVPAG